MNGGGLPVQPEEVEDQSQQQPVTKTRTAPVKPPLDGGIETK